MLQVWHAIGKDRSPLRKQYLETILPPFVAVLRRWRPLLAGIHELATADGINPLVVDDRALAADALPIEVIIRSILKHGSSTLSLAQNKIDRSFHFSSCMMLRESSFKNILAGGPCRIKYS